MTENISSPLAPPLPPRLDDDEMRLINFPKSQLYPKSIESQSQCLRKSGIQPAVSPSIPIEPIIMPVMMPQGNSIISFI